jgi:hypothetical protein
VKRSIADGSVGFPHVRVGHRQALILKPLVTHVIRGFFLPGVLMTICCADHGHGKVSFADQALILKPPSGNGWGFFLVSDLREGLPMTHLLHRSRSW